MKKKIMLSAVLAAIVGVCLMLAVACETRPETYEITFDPNGGVTEQTTVTVDYMSTVDLTPYVPHRENYEFVGWSYEGEIVTEILAFDDLTVVAEWKETITVSCDIETAEIVNDVIAFEAKASANGDPELTVTFNGDTVVVGDDGLYVLTLKKGLNEISIDAVCGKLSVEKNYEIDYKGFAIDTDLYDLTTGDGLYTFGATSFYGEEECLTKVEFEGETLHGKDGKYELSFKSDKTYEVIVGAVVDNMRYTETFNVTYDSSLPKFARMTLAPNKEYRGEILSFTLTATDANGVKLDDKNVAFYADFDLDDDNDEFTELTSSEISSVWSDDNATSYKLFLTNGKFADRFDKTVLLKVVLTSGGKSVERLYRVRYVGPDAEGYIGEVVVSIEGFTVGVGYLIEPVAVKIRKDEKFPVRLKELIEAKGWTMVYTGKQESGFYLAEIEGLDIPQNAVNARLAEVLDENYMTVDETSIAPEKDGTYTLGEFCYNSFSGWMYSINGMFANYGMSDYDPVDGDVVRIGFTLAYGADIGGAAAMGVLMPPVSENDADYGAFNTLVAKIIGNDYYGKGRDELERAFLAVTEWDAEQSVVDDATKTLEDYYFN